MIKWRILEIDWFFWPACPHSVYVHCRGSDVCMLCSRIRRSWRGRLIWEAQVITNDYV